MKSKQDGGRGHSGVHLPTMVSASDKKCFLVATVQTASMIILVLGLFVHGCTKKPEVAKVPPPKPEIIRPEPEPAPEPNRLDQWHALVREKRYAPEREKIRAVNDFFNGFRFVEDRYLWGREDYWATPLETLRQNGGDCEDFTIAKYFTLRKLLVADARMRITYVISLKTKKPHMVLTCALHSAGDPLVLDTENNDLFPVSRRPDLFPVYSFNQGGYWLAEKNQGWQGKWLGSAERLSRWWELLRRIEIEGARLAGTSRDRISPYSAQQRSTLTSR